MSKKGNDQGGGKKAGEKRNIKPASISVESASGKPLLSRRGFLLGGGAGVATLAVGGFAILHDWEGETDPDLPNQPITQEDVGREYAPMFTMLSEEKRKAQAQGKNLLVLGAEIHSNRNSLL